jgi:hypothetical protein
MRICVTINHVARDIFVLYGGISIHETAPLLLSLIGTDRYSLGHLDQPRKAVSHRLSPF